MKWVINWVIKDKVFTTETQRAQRMDDLIQTVGNPARIERQEVTKVARYWLEVNAMARPMEVRQDAAEYGSASTKENDP